MSALAAEQAAPDFWWARDDLGYVDGRLRFAGVDVAAASEAADQPLFLYSAPRVAANLARLQGALGGVGRPTRVYYAMKSNRFEPLLAAMARWVVGRALRAAVAAMANMVSCWVRACAVGYLILFTRFGISRFPYSAGI